MSTSVACELPGLWGASRSMNIRREELEPWALEAPIYLTKRLRTWAASVSSAVVPRARNLRLRKVRQVPAGREISRPRKGNHRRGHPMHIDALFPWLHGVERREVRRQWQDR